MRYLVVTLFGSEVPNSILETNRIGPFIEVLHSMVARYGQPSTLRVYVASEVGKNLGTSGRKVSTKTFSADVVKYLSRGRVVELSLWEAAAIIEKRDPAFFLQVHKFWDYEKGMGYNSVTPHGAGSCITLALEHQTLARTGGADAWLSACKDLFTFINGIVGWVEADTPWGRSERPNGLQSRLIEYRYKDIVEGDYGWGYRDGRPHVDLATNILNVEWGMFLGPGHVKGLGGEQGLLRLPGLTHKEVLGSSRAFVSVGEEPHSFTETERQQVAQALACLKANSV